MKVIIDGIVYPSHVLGEEKTYSVIPSNEACNKATTNFLYFTQNYPFNFIDKVWKDSHLVDHFRDKFAQCHNKYGASASVIRFFFELGTEHRNRLLLWVETNYNWKES